MSGLAGKATTGGGDYLLCPAGTHPSVLVGVIDLGTHWESYQGQLERKVRRILLCWEIECDIDGKDCRITVGRDFNVSINDKGGLFYGQKSSLRLLLEAWRGQQFADGDVIDPLKALGLACLVQITHEKTKGGKEVSRIKGASKLVKGMAPLKPTYNLVSYLADSDSAAPSEDWLPRVYGEKIEEVLERCLEWGGDGRRKSKGSPNGQSAAAEEASAYGTPFDEPSYAEDGIPY